MEFLPEFAVLIRIGSFNLYWYSLLLWCSICLAYLLIIKQTRKAGYEDDFINDFFFYGVIAGIVGARLWYVVFSPQNYLYFSNPLDIFKTWEGGLAIQGVIVGVAVLTIFYFKKRLLSILRILDIMMPTTLVAQALGRWGNFFNQEAYGTVVEESFFRFLPGFIKEGMFIGGQYRMPTFLLEGAFNVLGFILIYLVLRKYLIKKRGDRVYYYLLWTGVVRFIIEIYRTDNLIFLGYKSAQVFSVVYIIIAILGLTGVIDRFTKARKPLIIFDLDGTLTDSREIVGLTYNQLLKNHNIDRTLTAEELDDIFGPLLSVGLPKFFPDGNIEELFDEYRVIYDKLQVTKLQEIPYAKELLAYLKQEGYQLAIVSNKPHKGIESALEICGMREYLDAIVGFDDVKNAKPNKEPLLTACRNLGVGFDNVVMIGDSKDDILLAHNAGAFSIAVGYYESRREELIEQNPNRYVEDLREIKEILQEKHPWTHNMM